MKNLKSYLYQFLSESRIEQFEKVLAKRTNHFTVGLEDIFHSHNANAVIRSCDCFGIQNVHISENINTFNASRGVSKGAIKWVNMEIYKNTESSINHLKANNYQIIATSPHAKESSMHNFDISKKSAFFFGAEKKGLSDIVLDNADELINIPMVGHTESLNVSVSAAILLQTLTHRLRSSSLTWQLTEDEKEVQRLDWAKKSIKNIEIHLEYFRKLNIKNT